MTDNVERREFAPQMVALSLMGVASRDIAWLYGCDQRTVRGLLRERGVPPAPPNRPVSAWFQALRRRNVYQPPIDAPADVLSADELLAFGIVDGSINANGTARVDYAVVQRLLKGGLRVPEIARHLGVSKQAIYQHVKKAPLDD